MNPAPRADVFHFDDHLHCRYNWTIHTKYTSYSTHMLLLLITIIVIIIPRSHLYINISFYSLTGYSVTFNKPPRPKNSTIEHYICHPRIRINHVCQIPCLGLLTTDAVACCGRTCCDGHVTLGAELGPVFAPAPA